MHLARPRNASTPRQQLLLAWLLLCVLVVQGLAPLAATRMVLLRSNAGWTEVCSASGTRWVQTDPSIRKDATERTAPTTPKPAWHHANCWACVVGHQGIAAPPPPAAPAAFVAALTDAPPRYGHPAEPRPTAGLAPSRAPPALS